MQNIISQIKSYLSMEKESGVFDYLFSQRWKDRKPLLFKEEVEQCRKCQLSKTRNKVVFGDGDMHAKLMFVGEAPGYDEDRKGLPFVGEAGMLLTKIIEAMGLKRKDVYICNILKCRPPSNRNPLPEEISLCIEYLHKQIDQIQPKVICGLGKVASQALLNTSTTITKLRGNWQEFRGVKFMPTYHPAYLLRNPKDKKLVWQDMKQIMKAL